MCLSVGKPSSAIVVGAAWRLPAPVEENLQASLIPFDSIDQTPSGVWYPKAAKDKFAADRDRVTWYFLDFHAKLPDSLFKPEARTGDIE